MRQKTILTVGTFLEDNDTPVQQGKILSDLLSAEGHNVKCVSTIKNKVFRLADICFAVITGKHKNLFIQIFSGPAFIYASCAILLGKIFGKNVVGVLRGGNLPVYLKKKRLLKLCILRQVNHLIAPSGYLKKEFDNLNIPTVVIPNIINLQKYEYRVRSKISLNILWIRRYIDIYNPLMAIRVIKKLKEEYKDVHLTMAGGGVSSEIKRVVKDEGLEDNIEILGFISKEKINELGQLHDVFINTAIIDNLPVTVIEAMAMGLVVVCTNVGGLPFFLKDGENALLVDSDDADGMACQIKKLYNDNKLCEKLTIFAYETVAEFSWEKIRQKYFNNFV